MRTGQTSSSSCLGPTVADINRPRLCLWLLFSNCPLFLEVGSCNSWALVVLSLIRSPPPSPLPLSLSFFPCAEIWIPAPPFPSAIFALVWSLVRNLRREWAAQWVDELSPVKILSSPFPDIFVVKTRICGSSDSKVRRICNWSSNYTQRVLINECISVRMIHGSWCHVMDSVLGHCLFNISVGCSD